MDASEIIEMLLKFSKLNASEFAMKIGTKTTQAIYDLQRGRTKTISSSMADKIISCYPQVNKAWLLTGEGDMLNKPMRQVAKDEDVESPTTVLLLPMYAHGGTLNDFVTYAKENDCEKIISPIVGVDFAIQVSGDSMSPEYPNGSRVFIKRINEKAFIEWGKTYVLDTCNGTVVKRIVPSDREGFIRCISINPNPIYAPFDISLSDIFGIYKVLMCMAVK